MFTPPESYKHNSIFFGFRVTFRGFVYTPILKLIRQSLFNCGTDNVRSAPVLQVSLDDTLQICVQFTCHISLVVYTIQVNSYNIKMSKEECSLFHSPTDPAPLFFFPFIRELKGRKKKKKAVLVHSDTHNSRQVHIASRAETFLAFHKLAGRRVKNAYTMLLYTYRPIQLRVVSTREIQAGTLVASYFLIYIQIQYE